ncbi:small RNA degrading nuclease 1-like [Durio zibethinus]|uniref:Small RNA degrading nuclease 1-like n=1 Tax=Durio zibethinus TaxID=66656 RepID=A0A6P5YM55_DURZI|nr:small RNA degrading nuclease 1-like [Durio zibethinus]
MDEKLETAEKKVLVEIVKLVQKRGLEGTKGGWKDFLNTYDRKLGASLSDPSRRSNDVLVSFLKTFAKDDDLKLFDRVLQSHSNRNIVEQFRKQSQDNESPEQRLVRLTLEHPQYPLDYMFPTGDEEWIVTQPPKKSRMMKSNSMVAVDCEMVLCEDGTEALVRVCVVDRDLQVKIDELVKPNKAVADYRTEITGVAAGDLDGVTCSVVDIQKSMKKLLSNGTILVGHGLQNDLQVLKIDHARVIDTSYIFKYLDAPIYRKPSLNNLCKSLLGYEVRKPGAAHNCLDDACAAMKLVLAKLERGDIPLVQEDVTQPEMEKLLLHRIPINVHKEEISRVIPGAVAIEEKPSKKVQGRHYSAFAVFNSPQEANQAFENVDGNEEKDSSGLPQKLVRFLFGKGVTASLYIRKMAQDDFHHQLLSNKRAFQGEEKSSESKKLKTDQKIVETRENSNQLDDHLNEIERLKQELNEKYARIVWLEKSIESDKVKTDQKTVEVTTATSNQLDGHLKEIERLKQELKEKDSRIVLQDKMISNLLKKVDEMKKVPKKTK